MWIPNDEKYNILMPYDELFYNTKIHKQMKKIIKQIYLNKRITYKLNNSIHKVIRCKDSNYNLI